MSLHNNIPTPLKRKRKKHEEVLAIQEAHLANAYVLKMSRTEKMEEKSSLQKHPKSANGLSNYQEAPLQILFPSQQLDLEK